MHPAPANPQGPNSRGRDEVVPEKARHVLERLAAHRRAIEARLAADPAFRSLCEDHGEALEALRHWEASAGRHRAARILEFRCLVAELEREIEAALGIVRPDHG